MDQKITLKKLIKEDLEDFYLWASDPEVTKYMTWETYETKANALEFLNKIAEPHPYFKAICYQGKIVGSLTLEQGKGIDSCRAELGYVLAREYWGNGIATEAVKLAVQDGFSTLNIHRIEAFVDPANTASQKVLEKSGFTLEALLRNYIRFKGTVVDRRLFSIVRS